MSRRTLGLAALALAVALHALSVMAIAVESSHLNYNTAADLGSMLSGTAYNPFAQRVLMPWTIRLIRSVTPERVEAAIETWCLQNDGARYVLMHVDVPPELAYEAIVELALMYACLLGFAAFLYRLGRVLYSSSIVPAVLAPFLGLASTSSLWPQLYMYDYATLLIWAACLYEMRAQRWGRYLIWFSLGMLNRETTLYLLLPFLAYGRTAMPRAALVKYGMAQAALAVAIKGVLVVSFRDNPGGVAIWSIAGQFHHAFATPYDLIDWIGALAGVLLLTYRFRGKPLFLKCQLLVLVPLAAVYVTAGSPREYRVFLEVIPAASLLVADTLVAWWDGAYAR